MTPDTTQADDFDHYHAREGEVLRTSDIVRLLPDNCDSALDVGARDGHFSKLLADRVRAVTALDLDLPRIDHPRVHCIQGDVTRMELADDAYDLVVCTEVLEHIDPHKLDVACSELTRVCARYLLIGVPFRQDIRVGRTTCSQCRTHNPPWGHRSEFDERRLGALFRNLRQVERSYVGQNRDRTNALSRFLLDAAGNPYGTYGQQETCLGCGGNLHQAPPRNLARKALSKAGYLARRFTEPFGVERPAWIHVLFEKRR